jgi:hypothetical protein
MTALRADAAYFRKAREARFGKPLEEVVAGREKSVEGFRRTLEPMRLTSKTQPYPGGALHRTTPTTSCSARSNGRASSARSNCSPTVIRSTHGAKDCSTPSTAWPANPPGYQV